MNQKLLHQSEWLEADGLGGFASGTIGGIRTRRYHALLLTATRPPTGRMTLVNGLDAWVETDDGEFAISSQYYEPGIVAPDGMHRIESFEIEPWPRWIYCLEDGTRLSQEIFAVRDHSLTAIGWKLLTPSDRAVLRVRLFLSVRDYHQLHHENTDFQFAVQAGGSRVRWHPYEGAPGVRAELNGNYRHDPLWYRNFRYEHDLDRGLNGLEDLASPGELIWELQRGEARLLLSPDDHPPVNASFDELRAQEETRRQTFAIPLLRAADAYIVQRGRGSTIIAGYPWFTDWGRDTFIALRGLCLATGRLEDARAILLEWAGQVSQGMLPNAFPDGDAAPEYNSVDASLWYVVAVGEFLNIAEQEDALTPADAETLRRAVLEILAGYRDGTRYRIRMEGDGLLAAGTPGTQLTWMDAKVCDWVVTPRAGKPVEVQALWLNALRVAAEFEPSWGELFERGREAMIARFWDEERGYLCDVIDVDHRPGKLDRSLRPNQIFAVGGLPCAILEGDRARRVVEAVERHLWTPMGLRTLAPFEEGYHPHYQGGAYERDAAYHQGTVWPWLIGPFVEAWLRVNGNNANRRDEARRRFVRPLIDHLAVGGLGHISEIADAEPPFTPRGCPFQAWSLSELLRLELGILADHPALECRIGPAKAYYKVAAR